MESTNPKDKIGRTKPPLHLIPPTARVEEAMVMGLGAAKYGPYNWRQHSVAASVYIAAALRHIDSWFDGQDTDPESGCSHIAHARACMGIILDAKAVGKLVDDRPPAGKAAEMIEKATTCKLEIPCGTPFPSDNNDPKLVQHIRQAMRQAQDDVRACRSGGEETPAPTVRRLTVKDRPDLGHMWRIQLKGLGIREEVCEQILGGISFPNSPTAVGVMPKVYIAGPMRGIENHNFPAFDAARDRFIAAGWVVISPADIDRASGVTESTSQAQTCSSEAIREFAYRDLNTLIWLNANRGDAIGLLKGWEGSRGANAEFFTASWLGLRVLSAESLDDPHDLVSIHGLSQRLHLQFPMNICK